jgi:hypothetical protein
LQIQQRRQELCLEPFGIEFLGYGPVEIKRLIAHKLSGKRFNLRQFCPFK